MKETPGGFTGAAGGNADRDPVSHRSAEAAPIFGDEAFASHGNDRRIALRTTAVPPATPTTTGRRFASCDHNKSAQSISPTAIERSRSRDIARGQTFRDRPAATRRFKKKTSMFELSKRHYTWTSCARPWPVARSRGTLSTTKERICDQQPKLFNVSASVGTGVKIDV